MTTFNRDNVFSLVATAVQTGLKSTMIQSIGLAQLALTGDISEAQRLTLVGLSEVPPTSQNTEYNLYKYSGKLIKAAREALNTTEATKKLIMSVDLSDVESLELFQARCAMKKHYITTTAGFNAFISDNLTEEAKADKARLLQDKAPKKGKTPTATATATDTVSHAAGQQAAAMVDAENAIAGALADQIQHGDVIAAILKQVDGLSGEQVAIKMAEAWRADREALNAQLSELQAKYIAATAPRAKPTRKTA